MSDSSRQAVYLIPEVTYGTTPATPSFTRVRLNSCTLALAKDSFISEELRGDRQISDHSFGVRQVGGDIVAELTWGGAIDTLFEAALMGTWANDVLKAGVTRRSFSVMRHYSDLLAAANPYHLFSGVEVNTLNVQNAANNRTQVTFGLIGRDLPTINGTGVVGQVLGSPTTTNMMTSVIGSVSEGGVASGIVSDVNFTLENGLEIRPVVASDLTLRPSVGQSNCSGNLTAYFESSELLEKFIDSTESSLAFTCEDPAGNFFEFSFPRVKYSGGQADTSGQGSITIPLPFQALYQVAAATQLQITRA